MLQDAIIATVMDEDETLRFLHDSTVSVPQNTLSRSAVLRQAIPQGSSESDVTLTARKEVLAS